jgi:hypothetical protein
VERTQIVVSLMERLCGHEVDGCGASGNVKTDVLNCGDEKRDLIADLDGYLVDEIGYAKCGRIFIDLGIAK